MSKFEDHSALPRADAEPRAAPGAAASESPLAWLARRKNKDGRPLISDAEFAAGERLRADFWFARMTPSVTVNWSRLLTGGGEKRGSPDCGAEARDSVLAAQDRVRRALAAAGPELAGVLIDVCCHLKGLESVERQSGWPKRSGKLLLTIALRQLARHYGMTVESASDSAPRVTHWGAPDYRPQIDSET
jgi:hypothetical protein